jgi:carboxylesterase
MTIVDHSFVLGSGRTGFLLVHGLGGTPIEFKFAARGLARLGFAVHCCQLAGHCGDGADLLATRWSDWYESVEAALERMRGECDTVLVGGLSMGAVLALHLAAERPRDVDGLVLYAPTFWYDGWAVPWYRVLLPFLLLTAPGRLTISTLYRFVEREPYGIKDPAIRAVVAAALQSGDTTQAGILVTPGRSLCEFGVLAKRVRQELPEIRTPTLIVQAREDDLSSIRNAELLQRRLGGTVSTLVLDDSYHIVTVDRQRDLLIEASAAFAHVVTARRADTSTVHTIRQA